MLYYISIMFIIIIYDNAKLTFPRTPTATNNVPHAFL